MLNAHCKKMHWIFISSFRICAIKRCSILHIQCSVLLLFLLFTIVIQVQLIPSSTITVDRVQLSNRCQAVKDKGAVKAAYSLTYKLLDLVFTLHELAKSRGTGAGKGDPTKPVLNIERVSVLKIECFILLYRLNIYGALSVGWLVLMLNVPVNNFSVMFGQSHCFLGITSTFGE